MKILCDMWGLYADVVLRDKSGKQMLALGTEVVMRALSKLYGENNDGRLFSS